MDSFYGVFFHGGFQFSIHTLMYQRHQIACGMRDLDCGKPLHDRLGETQGLYNL